MKNLTNQNSNYSEVVNQVLNSFPSIFTREDVVELICKIQLVEVEKVEVEKEKAVNYQSIQKMIEKLKSDVESCISNHKPNIDDLYFDINNGNEIKLSDYNADMSDLESEVSSLFEDVESEIETEIEKAEKLEEQESN
tara:strand:- start:2086 stop:2499 length:414 start_codon:yes stop_codon:yes gene_type:complete